MGTVRIRDAAIKATGLMTACNSCSAFWGSSAVSCLFIPSQASGGERKLQAVATHCHSDLVLRKGEFLLFPVAGTTDQETGKESRGAAALQQINHARLALPVLGPRLGMDIREGESC